MKDGQKNNGLTSAHRGSGHPGGCIVRCSLVERIVAPTGGSNREARDYASFLDSQYHRINVQGTGDTSGNHIVALPEMNRRLSSIPGTTDDVSKLVRWPV